MLKRKNGNNKKSNKEFADKNKKKFRCRYKKNIWQKRRRRSSLKSSKQRNVKKSMLRKLGSTPKNKKREKNKKNLPKLQKEDKLNEILKMSEKRRQKNIFKWN